MINEQKLLDGYRRLMEISRDLASTLDLDVLLNRIVHAAADITDSKAASIMLYDDTDKQLHFQVATNLDQPMMRGLVVPLEGSIAGWIVTNRKPVRTAHAHDDPRHYSNIEQTTKFTTENLLGVPLMTKEKVIGVLEALNKCEGDFTDTDEDLLTFLGAQAAVAIENTRLFQQSDLISEFVHELRTPLAAISTATYLLVSPKISQEIRGQTIQNILGETQRLSALAASFLDVARLESGRVQFHIKQFNLKDLLEECVSFMQSKAAEDGISIRLDILPKFSFEADYDKIKQVVLNLLSNAIKYNRPNGSITVQAVKRDGEVILSVADTGIGIPEKSLPNLFQKFYRVRSAEGKAIGTGLGLSICKQIVLGHNGRIEVQSKMGEGTKFILHFPQRT